MVFDPTNQVTHKLTADLASRLAPYAYCFYRPFKEEPLKITDLVRFSLQGCGREIAMIAATGIQVRCNCRAKGERL